MEARSQKIASLTIVILISAFRVIKATRRSQAWKKLGKHKSAMCDSRGHGGVRKQTEL
jgi:hypothetical protein